MDALKDVLYVIGWSAFWIIVVLGVGAIILEWQAIERLLGL